MIDMLAVAGGDDGGDVIDDGVDQRRVLALRHEAR